MANDLMFLNIMDEEGNWVGIPGLKGDTGEPAPVVSIKGNYATAADLQAAISNPEPGFAGFVGTESPYDLYIYTEDNGWFNYGPVSGGSVDVDDSLSLVSQNPVQNAVITNKVGIDELDTSAQDLSAAINELYGLATTPEYGVCTTAAGTPEKAVSINGITALMTGLTIAVKFSAANTAANPTLNVNGLGPKPIYQYGTTPAAGTAETSGWQAGAVVLLTYDGTGWEMNKGFNAVPTNHASASDTYGKATSTNYGHVKISDDLTDTTPAATGGVVPSMKAVSDLLGSLNTITPFDTTPTSGSTKGVTSGGMFSALTNKTGSQFLEIPKTDAVESGLCNANFDKATNTVRIYLYVYNETTIIDNHTSLFTIPQGYRPNSGYGLVGVIGKSDGTFLTGFGRVAADGSVFQSTTATAKQCFLMGEYPIA